MDLRPYLRWIPPIQVDAPVYEAMRRFRSGEDPRGLPVVDSEGRVVGILRDDALRPYMFTPFGHELVKRHVIRSFISACPTLPLESTQEEALAAYTTHPNPDGLLVLEDHRYAGLLPTESLLALYEENRQHTRSQLLQSQKLEAIGTLAGGIAHDFNNVLMPIRGYSELLLRLLEAEGPARMYVEQIHKASLRARDLIQQILSFSRQQEQAAIVLSLRTLIDEVVKLLRASLPSNISIHTEIQTRKDFVLADPTQMHQVFMNLCINASQAMQERGGHLTLRVTEGPDRLEGWSTSPCELQGAFLDVSVQDTGCGIDPAHFEKLFTPFFTTKPVGEGTGLGLAVAHGLVTHMGGHISVLSERGVGTVFHLYFPQAQAPEAIQPSPETQAPPSPTSCHLVLVDDERDILDLLSTYLKGLGHQVQAFARGSLALDHLNTHATVDALITDFTMPGLSGLDLARSVRLQRPSLPIILLTGNSRQFKDAQAVVEAVMEKPVNLQELAEVLARVTLKSQAARPLRSAG